MKPIKRISVEISNGEKGPGVEVRADGPDCVLIGQSGREDLVYVSRESLPALITLLATFLTEAEASE